MQHCDPGIVQSPDKSTAPKAFQRFLRWFAFFIMLMTIPQVVNVWRDGPAGVSLVSWSAYLVSSFAWLAYGIRQRDPTIWLVCIGWIVVDGAVVVGILVR